MALQQKSKSIINNAVADLSAFKVGNVSGEWYPTWSDVPMGRLSTHENDVALAMCESRPVYVIFSYGTPIAYRSDALAANSDDGWGWVMPAVKYSVTTTNHQGVVGVAISVHSH